ncbi:MAG: hypothetical protein QNK23_14800 [Crocinitomicaceae bacterium]|nr:hypothetical protein [Crocinitomicaceae bacterium]
MPLRTIFVIFLAIAQSTILLGQDSSWKTLKWGMTKAEVRAALEKKNIEVYRAGENFKYKEFFCYLSFTEDDLLDKIRFESHFHRLDRKLAYAFLKKKKRKFKFKYGKQYIAIEDNNYTSFLWVTEYSRITLSYNPEPRNVDEFGSGAYSIDIEVTKR